jgi:hypothetical protein
MTNLDPPGSSRPATQAAQEWHEAIERYVAHLRASRREPRDPERERRQDVLRRDLAEKYEAYRSAMDLPPP